MLYYNIILPVNPNVKTSTMVQLKSIFIKTHVFAVVAVITLTVGAMETRAKEIYVAASIRPLHSLVQMVLGEQGQAVLLMEGRVSPHNIVLRPSDRKHLSKADLVFIIDPGFEPLFAKALSTRDRNERLVVMTKAEGIRKRERRLNGAFGHEDHVHDDEHDDEKHDDHDDHGHSHDNHGHDHLYGKFDLHLWLDPANAAVMIDLIQKRLAAVYPSKADIFQQNATAAKQDLMTLDADIHALLSPYKDRKVIVYHDAYSYFEDAYGIKARASILDHHDAQADIRRVRMLRQLVASDEIACLFHEPQFDAKLLNLIDPQSRLRHVSLDPIGHDFVAGADQYRLMMMGIARSMVSCFQ